MERVVIAFGGSTLAGPELQADYLKQVAKHLQAWGKERKLFVAIGGGHAARRYIDAARQCQVGEEELDRIGVAATRLNAQLMASLLHAYGANVNRDIPQSIQEALALPNQIVVMGGTTPGHSTDFVAAQLAQASQANRLLIVTNVDGVYTADPRDDPNAERVSALTFDELLQIIEEKEWSTAGAPGVIDGPATILIAEEGIETCVLKGTDLANVQSAVQGHRFHGSHITGDKVTV